MNEKDITICGHGSGTPSLKNMEWYLSYRYKEMMDNGVRKKLIAVRRLKALDNDYKRQRFHDLYASILGRNTYSQDRRQYVYTALKGRYYSDCSSSGCATYQRCGAEIPLLNTAGMLGSDLFETVDCGIEHGHVVRPELLKVGDALLFAGNEKRREQSYVGHVEYIYEMPQTLRSGWETADGRWRYIEDGEPVRDAWRYIGGRYYCFDGAGRMIAQSWHKDGPFWYFLGADGAMLAGQWLHFDDAWFYLEADGRMATDVFVPDPRGWCYVDADGEWDGRYHETKPIGPGVRIVGEQEH